MVCIPITVYFSFYALMHFILSQFQAVHVPNPEATLSSFPTLPNTYTHPPSTTSSCPGASTGAEHLWLQRASYSLHCLYKEAKNMKNGLSRSHPSKLGMLSSAFIHFCDLSSVWIPGTWYHSLNYFWGVMALDICNVGCWGTNSVQQAEGHFTETSRPNFQIWSRI